MKTINSPTTPTVVKYLTKNGFEILSDGTIKDYITERERTLSKGELTAARKVIKGQIIFRVWKNELFLGFKTEPELEILKKYTIRANKLAKICKDL